MKKLTIFTGTFFCLMAGMIACDKENSASKGGAPQTTITTNKPSLKPGEALVVSVQNATPGTVAQWKVTPNTNVSVNREYSWDQKDTITFSDPGTYVVSADIKKVWCDSAAASHPGMDTCLNHGTVTSSAQTTITVKN